MGFFSKSRHVVKTFSEIPFSSKKGCRYCPIAYQLDNAGRKAIAYNHVMTQKPETTQRNEETQDGGSTMDKTEIAALPELMTCAQVSRLIGMSLVHTQRLCREGGIPAVKVGTEWRVNKTRLLEMLGIPQG